MDSFGKKVWVKRELAPKKSKSKASMVRQLKEAVVQSMKSSEEVKHFDQYSAGSLAPVGTITCLTDLSQGIDVSSRIGNVVTYNHLSFKLTCTIHPNAINGYFRVILLVDKQGYNAPTIADVLEPIGLSSPFVAVLPYRWDYKKRFKILFDKKVVLTQAAITANCVEVETPLKLKSNNIGASTTFTNQVWVLLQSTEQNVLALPGFYWYSRLTFTDS